MDKHPKHFQSPTSEHPQIPHAPNPHSTPAEPRCPICGTFCGDCDPGEKFDCVCCGAPLYAVPEHISEGCIEEDTGSVAYVRVDTAALRPGELAERTFRIGAFLLSTVLIAEADNAERAKRAASAEPQRQKGSVRINPAPADHIPSHPRVLTRDQVDTLLNGLADDMEADCPPADYKPWWKENHPAYNPKEHDYLKWSDIDVGDPVFYPRKELAPGEPLVKPIPTLLQEADALINGERAEQYGDATDSFTHIAALWGAYLGQPIRPADVAILMALLKFSRLKHSGYSHHDSFVDAAGYIALAEKVKSGNMEENA